MQDTGSRFVEQLKAKQGGLTGAEFARTLGISKSLWSLIQSGRRQPSRDVIRRALRLWPDLSYWLAEDAREGAA